MVSCMPLVKRIKVSWLFVVWKLKERYDRIEGYLDISLSLQGSNQTDNTPLELHQKNLLALHSIHFLLEARNKMQQCVSLQQQQREMDVKSCNQRRIFGLDSQPGTIRRSLASRHHVFFSLNIGDNKSHFWQ